MTWLKAIFSAMKSFKDWLDLIIKIVAVVGLLTGLVSMKTCTKNKKEKVQIEKLFTNQIEQVKTKSGKQAAEIDNINLSYNNLLALHENLKAKNKSKLSQKEHELNEAYQTIKDLKIRQKNTENYIKNELISRDSIRTELVFLNCDEIEIKPIKKEFIEIDFVQIDNFLDVKYKYIASIETVISRYPKLKHNGKKHFPNWGRLWGWDYKTTSTTKDPNATITNIVSIEFNK